MFCSLFSSKINVFVVNYPISLGTFLLLIITHTVHFYHACVNQKKLAFYYNYLSQRITIFKKDFFFKNRESMCFR